MQFTKLRSMELKHSIVSHFCIQTYGNKIIIDNPISEAVVLSLNNEPDVAELFPYAATTVSVPKDQLASKLLKGVDLQQIYENSTVLDQQEFGLDPIFVSECSLEPTKPRLQQASPSPHTSDEREMLAIISSYGDCHILIKKLCDRKWKEHLANLTQTLICEVFPIIKSPCDLKTFPDLRDFVNLYIITACAWRYCGSVIYVANSASYIIAFRIRCGTIEQDSKDNEGCSFLYKIHANLGRIGYLKAFDDFLIVVGINGVMRLFKIQNESGEGLGKLENVENLWEHIDRVCCRQIVIQKCKNDGYTILFAKGSNVICMQISDRGKLEGRAKLLIPGIKITGLELFHENELIVTTITGSVVCVSFSCIMEKGCFQSLRLKADPVNTPNLDAENYQILGIGTTANKALWFVMTSRNNEQGILTKQVIFPSYLLLCKSNLIDPLTRLNNVSSDTMDPYHDLVLALRLEVWHSNMTDKYNQQSKFISSIARLEKLDDSFLRKAQIQLDIARTTFRQSSFKLQIVNEVLLTQIDFLESVIKITHILLRLEYLQGLIDNERVMDDTSMYPTLTELQRNSGNCMRNHFYFLIEKLQAFSRESSKKDSIIIIKEVSIDFVELAFRSLNLKCQNFETGEENPPVKEACLLCNEVLNGQELMCPAGHSVMRCCVSFVQLPLFNRRYCVQCGTMALDCTNSCDVLTELFPPSERVKCTLCRSVFAVKEIL